MGSLEEQLKSLGRPLSDFRRLEALRVFLLEDRDGFPDPALELTLATEDASRARITLRAYGVREFRVGFTAPPIQIMGLAIESIRDRQWDRLRWRAIDREDNKVAFFCDHVELA